MGAFTCSLVKIRMKVQSGVRLGLEKKAGECIVQHLSNIIDI